MWVNTVTCILSESWHTISTCTQFIWEFYLLIVSNLQAYLCAIRVIIFSIISTIRHVISAVNSVSTLMYGARIREFQNLSWVRGPKWKEGIEKPDPRITVWHHKARKICPEDHCLASRDLVMPDSDHGDKASWCQAVIFGTDFSIQSSHKSGFFILLNIKFSDFLSQKLHGSYCDRLRTTSAVRLAETFSLNDISS